MKKSYVFTFFLIVSIFCPLVLGNINYDELFFAGRVFINLDFFHVTIHSPQNITYNITNGNFSIDLNVSSDRNVSSWRYTLINLNNNQTVNNSIFFTPNYSIYAVVGSNKLIVSANDTVGNEQNTSVVFSVLIGNHAPAIENAVSENYVCEGRALNYFFNVSDVDGDTITASLNPQHPSNPFYISHFSEISPTLDSYRIFSGLLNKNDAGGVNNGSKIYAERISVSDDLNSDYKDINITVIEINNAPIVDSIGVRTFWTQGENSSFNYQVQASDAENGDENSGNITFNISFKGGTNLFNISAYGVMNFSANSSFIGTHNISVCAIDKGLENPHANISICSQNGGNLSTCVDFNIVITSENRRPNITSYYPLNFSFSSAGDSTIYFNISKHDSDGPADSYWYIDNILKQYDSSRANYSYDEFSYSFGCGVSRKYSVKAVVSDGELNSSVEWNISISYSQCPISLAGGGGSGGGKLVYCKEDWGCEEWSECNNLEYFFDSGKIKKGYKVLIEERCSLFKWGDNICGFQTRKCKDLNLCNTNFSKPGLLRECYYTPNPSCNDGIKNCHNGSCEVLADCGGTCSPCPSCSDKIKNQNEENVDCGGPCPACIKAKEIPKNYINLFLIGIFFPIFIYALIMIILYLVRLYQNREKLKIIEKRKILNSAK